MLGVLILSGLIAGIIAFGFLDLDRAYDPNDRWDDARTRGWRR